MDDAVVTFPEHAVPSEWFDDVCRDHWRGMVRLAFGGQTPVDSRELTTEYPPGISGQAALWAPSDRDE